MLHSLSKQAVDYNTTTSKTSTNPETPKYSHGSFTAFDSIHDLKIITTEKNAEGSAQKPTDLHFNMLTCSKPYDRTVAPLEPQRSKRNDGRKHTVRMCCVRIAAQTRRAKDGKSDRSHPAAFAIRQRPGAIALPVLQNKTPCQ
jgi:hypothetical protein